MLGVWKARDPVLVPFSYVMVIVGKLGCEPVVRRRPWAAIASLSNSTDLDGGRARAQW